MNFPYIAPSQAQKHVTHNEAIRALDILAQISVLDRDLSAPPASPQEGDCYLVASGATGDWDGRDNAIAGFQDGAWSLHDPVEGCLAWVADEQLLVVWTSGAWTEMAGGDGQFDSVGVNTRADPVNRLAVKSEATLLDHDGAGHQVKVNKSQAGDTASLLFQTGYSGRTEIGTSGDDNLHVKVSGDGSNWKEAMVIDSASAAVAFPRSAALNAPCLFNLFGDGGRFLGAPEPQAVTGGTFTAPAYFQPYNGSNFASGPKFFFNNSTHGGTAGALDPLVDDLIQKTHPGGGISYRYRPEFHTMKIDAGSGTSSAVNVSGTYYYLGIVTRSAAVPPRFSMNFWLYVYAGSVALTRTAENRLYVDGLEKTGSHIVSNSDGWVQVTRLLDHDADKFAGYATSIARLYMALGSQVHIAMPLLFPGRLPVGADTRYSTVGSYGVWR